MSPVFRPATSADLTSFFGEPPKQTMRAWVMLIDDKVVGVGGVIYQPPFNAAYLFSEIKPEAKKHRIAMARGALRGLREIGASSILAIADPEEQGSTRFLVFLGFHYYASSVKGEVFRWHSYDERAA